MGTFFDKKLQFTWSLTELGDVTYDTPVFMVIQEGQESFKALDHGSRHTQRMYPGSMTLVFFERADAEWLVQILKSERGEVCSIFEATPTGLYRAYGVDEQPYAFCRIEGDVMKVWEIKLTTDIIKDDGRRSLKFGVITPETVGTSGPDKAASPAMFKVDELDYFGFGVRRT